ncbi:olfactory receptor 52K1-like [Clupea harengus]|uniref:Olfactory receptor 52K1-like n=1 Tax=Clupea harengus TaxID=7950 RepID=A0A6P8FTP0_CLUHA|nr:olfactory receptor 52K1-like [Clupea harengus]
MNVSSITVTLILTVYKDMNSDKNVFFIVVFLIYIASILTNITLMLLIYLDTSLHKPMYIFLFSLIVNGLIGSTAVWPKVMVILLTGMNTTSYAGCLIQIFLTSTYGVCHFTVLTVMAYDRLVSIFKPLQYHTIMTPQKVRQLLLAANLVPVVCVFGQVFLTSQVPLCKNTLRRIFCDNLSLSSLACGDSIQSRVTNLYGICSIIAFIILPLLLVLLSYVKIIVFILKASGNNGKKAFETCSPHMIVFINFSIATLFSVIYNRLNPYLPGEAYVLLSINYILVPPLLHPVIYGIKNQEIRDSISKMWKRKIRTI